MIIRPVQYFLIALLFLFSAPVFAQHSAQDQDAHTVIGGEEHQENEAFNAGEMIIEHIVDSYEWHILSYGDFHLSIPLPVIVYRDGDLITYMSSAMHHGHSPALFNENGELIQADEAEHQQAAFGLAIMHEGAHKGKLAYIDLKEYQENHAIVENIEAGMPYDFSISKNVISLWFSLAIILWVFFSIAKSYKVRKGLAPKGMQSALEPFIIFIRDEIAKESIGEKKYEKYLPYLLTIFFFIFLNNLLGLIPFFPGGANLTGNIAVTMVLALFTFVITNVSGNKNYWTHLVNAPGVPWWLKIPIPLMPIVELVGLITKPFVLMVRLFANITAGHIIVLGFISLIFIFGNLSPVAGYGVSVVSIAFAIFLTFLEFLVALIQAYVFTLLSALYFGAATEEHH